MTDEVVNKFVSYLRKSKRDNHNGYVIFKHGTIVEYNNLGDNFKGFDESYDFPVHRIKSTSDIKRIISLNKSKWKTCQKSELASIFSKVYNTLIQSGYPDIDDDFTNIIAEPISSDSSLFLIRLNSLIENIMTLSYKIFKEEVILMDMMTYHIKNGVKNNRLDYMMPNIIAYIPPNSFKVMRFEF